MLAFPHGGQETARRNALDRVSEDLVAAHERAEAYAAVQRATNSRTASTASNAANAFRNVASG
jgi:hypothetical protein